MSHSLGRLADVDRSALISLAYRPPARSSDRSLVANRSTELSSLPPFLFFENARAPVAAKLSGPPRRVAAMAGRGAARHERRRREAGVPRTARLAGGGPVGETTDFGADHKFSQLERMLLTAAVCTEMPAHRLGQHWRGEAASAGLGGGCSKSSEPEDTVQGVVRRLPQRAARARRRRREQRASRHRRGSTQRAIATVAARPGPAGHPRGPGEAPYNPGSVLSKLPSSHEPCRLVAGDASEEPTVAS